MGASLPPDFAPRSLSIIIPALNAGTGLAATLRSVGACDEGSGFARRPPIQRADQPERAEVVLNQEIIVVDGGSTDHTVAVAQAAGARVLATTRGRGPQIAAGVAAAGQPWLLILHADTCLQPGWRQAVAKHDDPGRAGYFHFALDNTARQARRLERIVDWRSRVLGLPYGDQGLLIHRDLLRQVGGIRPLPLMEDVDLIRRLGRKRLVALPAKAVTSAAKWEREGYMRRSARNLMCLSLWFAGVPPRLIQKLYA